MDAGLGRSPQAWPETFTIVAAFGEQSGDRANISWGINRWPFRNATCTANASFTAIVSEI
jgi:hypothetical protein